MVPEIWCVTDIIFCHCGPFFALLLPLTTRKIKIWKKWKKHLEILSFYTCVPQMTIMWWMVPEIWSVTDRMFCRFGLFLPFTTLKNKKKQTPGDIIILHKCIKNHNHMLYCSWDIMCDRSNCYSSFGAIFLPFYPLNCLKNEN